MKRITLYLGLASLMMLVLASCSKGGKSLITPVSSGRPYEVLVVADDNCWMSPDSALSMCWIQMYPVCRKLSVLSVSHGFVLAFTTAACDCSVTSLS